MEVLEKRIPKILSRIAEVADFRRIASEALKGESAVVVSGLPESAKALFVAGFWQAVRRPLVVVTPQDRAVSSLAADIDYFHSVLNAAVANEVCSFPAWEADPYAGLSPHAAIQQVRATTLWRLRQKQADIVVASIRSVSTRLTSPERFDTYSLHISAGDDISQELLTEHL